jgi:hypothetical protein
MKGRFRRPKGIPVGKDGYVPEREIVRRYQEVGDFSDSNTDDSLILPRKLTPQEIEQWWEDPSVCDIEGIDTKDSDIYSVPLSIRGRKRKALKRIAGPDGNHVEPECSGNWARHTWATMCAELDVPDPTISLGMGHRIAGHRTTAIYIKRDQRKVDEANRLVIDYVTKTVPHLTAQDGNT